MFRSPLWVIRAWFICLALPRLVIVVECDFCCHEFHKRITSMTLPTFSIHTPAATADPSTTNTCDALHSYPPPSTVPCVICSFIFLFNPSDSCTTHSYPRHCALLPTAVSINRSSCTHCLLIQRVLPTPWYTLRVQWFWAPSHSPFHPTVHANATVW